MTYSFNKRLTFLLVFFISIKGVCLLPCLFSFMVNLFVIWFFLPKIYRVFRFIFNRYLKRSFSRNFSHNKSVHEFILKWFGLRVFSPYPILTVKRSQKNKNIFCVEINSFDIRKFLELDLTFVIRIPTISEICTFVKLTLKTLKNVFLKLLNKSIADFINNFIKNYFLKILLTHILKIIVFLISIFLAEKLFFFALEPTNNLFLDFSSRFFFDEGSNAGELNLGSLRYKSLISVSDKSSVKGMLVLYGIVVVFIVHSVLGFISLIYDYVFKHVKTEDLWLLFLIITLIYY